MAEGDELGRQAADPRTPLTTLHRIAQERPDLRPALAANPATYPALLEWLAALGDPEVDQALAARGGAGSSGESGASAEPEVQEPVTAPQQPGPEDPERTAVLDRVEDTAVTPAVQEPPRSGRQDPEATQVLRPEAPADGPASYAPVPVAPPTVPPAGTPLTVDPRTPAAGTGPVTSSDGGSRRPLWVALVLVAALVVGGAVWALALRGGEEPTAEAPPAATAPTDPAPTTAAATTDVDRGYEEARASLLALPETSECAELSADAQVVRTFAAAAVTEGAWQEQGRDDLLQVMSGLQDTCGTAYAWDLRERLLRRPGLSPAAVTALSDQAGWIEVARPAPAGAQDRDGFVSPSQNISCELTGDGVRCTIQERSFSAPAGCGDGPVTVVVGATGPASVDCGAPAARASGVLEYGQAAASGPFACTSESDGVTCWSTLTGRGFSLARAGAETF